MDSRPRTGSRPTAPLIRPQSSKPVPESASFRELLASCKLAALTKEEVANNQVYMKEPSNAKPAMSSMPGWLSERRSSKTTAFNRGSFQAHLRPHTARDRVMASEEMPHRELCVSSSRRPSRPRSSPPRQYAGPEDAYLNNASKKEPVRLKTDTDSVVFNDLNARNTMSTRAPRQMLTRTDADTLDSGTFDAIVGPMLQLNSNHHVTATITQHHSNHNHNFEKEKMSTASSSSSTLLRGFMNSVTEGRTGFDAAVEDMCIALTAACASLDADEIIKRIRDITSEALR
jgi:hypothetical protein